MLEESGDDLADDNFGQNYQYTWIPCYSFTPYTSSTRYSINGNYRYFTSATDMVMEASLNLPSGAYLNLARLYYYDNSGGSLSMYLWREYLSNNWTTVASGSTSGTPGYSSLPLYCYHTIANGTNMYHIRVIGTAATSNLRFMGVRLFWKRQIRTGLSHPFNDIGGLPVEFRNSIAALYRSGITTGTSSTTFSPYNNLTRAQMAVFLARALGLHWAYPY